jgi:NAD(P)-dependent dehydrogenase (short-subunit alcohol dehydrogenase family)
MFSLTGKTAIVTGAASGIGAAIARLFAARGAHVHVLDIDIAGAERVAAAIRQADGIAEPRACDVSDGTAVSSTFEAIASAARLDLLVNNAGIAHIGTIENTTEADFDRLYRVNVKGVYLCAQAGVRIMLRQGGGVILNMASIASLIALPERFAYSMSKGAVLTMTRAIALDFVKRNIRCNCICPARVHTPFIDRYLAANYPGRERQMLQELSEYQPVGRMGTPEEIAQLALYLCSDEASFITGQAYPIDGGVLMA